MSRSDNSPKLETQARSNRWQKTVLAGIVIVNLVLYGGVFLMSQNTSRSARFSRPVADPVPLQGAYKQALAAALNWRPDVQLFSVTTCWQLASGDTLTLHRSAWSFNFYSPSARQTQTIVVDASGAQMGRNHTITTVPHHVVPDWNIDSDALLLTFFSYGGQEFINAHPAANIHVQLKADNTGRPIWYLTAVDPVARQSITVAMDAQSRQIVTNQPNAGGG